jgi:hypothetical protein
MGSRAVTLAAYAVLMVVAGILVGISVTSERAESAKPEAVTRAKLSPEEAEQAVCAVCLHKHPKDEMRLLALESLGYAPDSLPVLVCSEACRDKALGDPEKHRTAAISGAGQETGGE